MYSAMNLESNKQSKIVPLEYIIINMNSRACLIHMFLVYTYLIKE